jgi:hypothetical protein
MQIVKEDNLPILNFALCNLHFALKFSQLQSAKLLQEIKIRPRTGTQGWLSQKIIGDPLDESRRIQEKAKNDRRPSNEAVPRSLSSKACPF